MVHLSGAWLPVNQVTTECASQTRRSVLYFTRNSHSFPPQIACPFEGSANTSTVAMMLVGLASAASLRYNLGWRWHRVGSVIHLPGVGSSETEVSMRPVDLSIMCGR